MKNLTKIILILLTVVICLSSCFEQSLTEAEKVAGEISEIIASGFDSYTLTITVTSPSAHTQKETYNVRTENGKKIADYKIESPEKFDISNNEITAPDAYTSSSSGESTHLDLNAFAVPQFDFSDDAIKNLSYANGIMSASIASLDVFLGTNGISAKNAKFAISYANGNINYIAIYYTSSRGNSVTVKYTF